MHPAVRRHNLSAFKVGITSLEVGCFSSRLSKNQTASSNVPRTEQPFDTALSTACSYVAQLGSSRTQQTLGTHHTIHLSDKVKYHRAKTLTVVRKAKQHLSLPHITHRRHMDGTSVQKSTPTLIGPIALVAAHLIHHTKQHF